MGNYTRKEKTAFEPEVFRLPGAVFCRLDDVDERPTVRFNGSVSVQRVKHVVDGANVLLPIMVHAKGAAPFGLDGEQDDALGFRTSSRNSSGL